MTGNHTLRLSAWCVGVTAGLLLTAVQAENWPGWRGPRGDGTSRETVAPLRWSETENIRWKVPIPGKGHSSPIVWNDRVFVTTCIEANGQRLLLCLDRSSGRERWRRTVFTGPLERIHRLNSYASSTPATDGHYVWVSFLDRSRMLIVCYDFNGEEIWRKSPGRFYSRHGYCSSPVLYKDLVIVNGDQDGEAWIVALDKATGRERWRADRPNRTRSYCVPILIQHGGKTQLVLSGSKCVAAYDPDTGEQLWIVDGPTDQFVASLVYRDGILFVTGGYPEYHLMAIRPDGRGNVTKTHVAWHHRRVGNRRAAYVPSPIAHGHRFFLVTDIGYVSCLDIATGKTIWHRRLGRHFSASPVSVGDRLYFCDDDGNTFVVAAADQFRLLAKNTLDDECYASPAVSDGEIFIRTLKRLYCIRETAASAGAEE